jgi:ABC-type uncharacterized transport system permease subunit
MQASRTAKNLACIALMTAVGALALRWWGWSLWTALLVAVLLSCPVAMLYAWYVSRRAEAATRAAAASLRRAAGRRP